MHKTLRDISAKVPRKLREGAGQSKGAFLKGMAQQALQIYSQHTIFCGDKGFCDASGMFTAAIMKNGRSGIWTITTGSATTFRIPVVECRPLLTNVPLRYGNSGTLKGSFSNPYEGRYEAFIDGTSKVHDAIIRRER